LFGYYLPGIYVEEQLPIKTPCVDHGCLPDALLICLLICIESGMSVELAFAARRQMRWQKNSVELAKSFTSQR